MEKIIMKKMLLYVMLILLLMTLSAVLVAYVYDKACYDAIKVARNNTVGDFVKTLIVIDENTSIDLHEISLPYRRDNLDLLSVDIDSSFAGNASQLILKQDDERRIL